MKKILFSFLLVLFVIIQSLTGARMYRYQFNAENLQGNHGHDFLIIRDQSQKTTLESKNLLIRINRKSQKTVIVFPGIRCFFSGKLPVKGNAVFTRFALIRLNQLQWNLDVEEKQHMLPDSSLPKNGHAVNKILSVYAMLTGLNEYDVSVLAGSPVPVTSLHFKRRFASGKGNWHLLLQSDEPADQGRQDNLFLKKMQPVSRISTRVLKNRPAAHSVQAVKSHPGILKAVKLLAEGYRKRDVRTVEQWCRDLLHPDISLLGTGAVTPGSFEWIEGIHHCIRVFKNDWEHWGQVNFDLNELHVRVVKNGVVMIDLPAVLSKGISRFMDSSPRSRSLKNALARTGEYIADPELNTDQKALHIIWDISRILKQYSTGGRFHWPLRITGVLIRHQKRWKFIEMHWSHANRGFASVRINPKSKIMH